GRRDAAGQVVGIGALGCRRIAPQLLEPLTGVQHQAGHACGATRQLGARDHRALSGRCERAAGALELDRLDPGVTRHVGLDVALERVVSVQLPFGHPWLAPATGEPDENQRGQDNAVHGSFTSVSRASGHLRLSSLIMPSILRRFASTSPRKDPRSPVAPRTLAPMPCASSSTASTFFRLSRVSDSRLPNCATVAWASCITPCGPNTWVSAFAASVSARASRALVRSSAATSFAASASLPKATPSAP